MTLIWRKTPRRKKNWTKEIREELLRNRLRRNIRKRRRKVTQTPVMIPLLPQTMMILTWRIRRLKRRPKRKKDKMALGKLPQPKDKLMKNKKRLQRKNRKKISLIYWEETLLLFSSLNNLPTIWQIWIVVFLSCRELLSSNSSYPPRTKMLLPRLTWTSNLQTPSTSFQGGWPSSRTHLPQIIFWIWGWAQTLSELNLRWTNNSKETSNSSRINHFSHRSEPQLNHRWTNLPLEWATSNPRCNNSSNRTSSLSSILITMLGCLLRILCKPTFRQAVGCLGARTQPLLKSQSGTKMMFGPRAVAYLIWAIWSRLPPCKSHLSRLLTYFNKTVKRWTESGTTLWANSNSSLSSSSKDLPSSLTQWASYNNNSSSSSSSSWEGWETWEEWGLWVTWVDLN